MIMADEQDQGQVTEQAPVDSAPEATGSESAPQTYEEHFEASRAGHIAKFNELAGIEPAKEPEPGKSVEQTEQKTTERAEQVEPKKLEDARHALKRDNWPDDLLADLPQHRIIELGEKAKSRQDNQSRQHSEYEQWKQNQSLFSEESKKQEAEGTKAADPARAETPPQIDLSKIEEGIGKEEAQAIREALSTHSEAITRAAKQEIERVRTELTESFNQQIREGERQKIEDRFYSEMDRLAQTGDLPQLKDQEIRKLVHAKAASLSNIGDGSYLDESGRIDFTKLVTDSTALINSRATIDQQQKQITQRHIVESNGQPSNGTQQQAPPRSMQPDDLHKEAIELLKSGMTPEEVRKKLHEMAPQNA